jgi:hypothetical protein
MHFVHSVGVGLNDMAVFHHIGLVGFLPIKNFGFMNVGNGFSLCYSHLFDDLKMQIKLVCDPSIKNSYLGAVYYIAVNEFVSL